MDTGTLPIVRPCFLKKCSFSFRLPPLGGGGWAPRSPPPAAALPPQCPSSAGGAPREPWGAAHGPSIPSGHPALGLSSIQEGNPQNQDACVPPASRLWKHHVPSVTYARGTKMLLRTG